MLYFGHDGAEKLNLLSLCVTRSHVEYKTYEHARALADEKVRIEKP